MLLISAWPLHLDPALMAEVEEALCVSEREREDRRRGGVGDTFHDL